MNWILYLGDASPFLSGSSRHLPGLCLNKLFDRLFTRASLLQQETVQDFVYLLVLRILISWFSKTDQWPVLAPRIIIPAVLLNSIPLALLTD